MKALIITYYWPPAGGSGVQRWLKFVKYLQEFGIEPVVFTVKNPKYPILDTSLQVDIPKNITIIKQPIYEPNRILSFFKRTKKQSTGFLNSTPSFLGKLIQYIRANFFIPDARMYWIKPSIRFLKKYLSKNKIDIIITTGPPHSLHLIGLELKKEITIKWVSDFRDPWTDIDYFQQLPLTKKSKKKHYELEKKVLQNSDIILVIGKTMKNNYIQFSDNIHIITNGYDTINSYIENFKLDTTFSITHIGMMNSDRNPKILWKVLSEICIENENFNEDLEIKFIGKIDNEVTNDLHKYQFKKITKIDYLEHKEVVKFQRQSQILLLAVNKVPSAKGIITGKIFEYLQAKRPILAIGPEDGDLAEILKSTESGIIIDFDNEEKLKTKILSFYNKFKNKNLKVYSKNIEKFHRRELTKQLSDIIIKETIEN